MNKPLRISRLTEVDFMRIRALDITPGEKALVILRGENEQGKTSAIRAIISALCGKRFDPDVAIRDGAERAEVQLHLADDLADRLRVRVSWTPKGRYLEVTQFTDVGPVKMPAGQSLVDSLVSSLTYNPLAFMNAKSRDQLEMLMDAVGKRADFDKLHQRRNHLMEERRVAKRQIESAEAALALTPDPAPDKTLVPIDETGLKDLINKSQAAITEYETYKTRLANFEADTERLQRHAASLEEQIQRLQAEREDTVQKITERKVKEAEGKKRLEQLAAAVPAVQDVSDRIAAAQAHNDSVQRQKQHRVQADALARLRAEAARFDRDITNIDNELCSILARSEINRQVPDLSIAVDGTILHRDLPIGQASGKQQLELSCLIGMAMNPQIRVMCIDESDRLDKASLDHLADIASRHGYQVWMTAVYAGDESSSQQHLVEIHDGTAVKGGATTPAPPPATKKNGTTEPVHVDPNELDAMYAGVQLGSSAAPAATDIVDLDSLEL